MLYNMIFNYLSIHVSLFSLRDVYMDIAEPRNTQQERAYAVEQCACPIGYIGLSCEVSKEEEKREISIII